MRGRHASASPPAGCARLDDRHCCAGIPSSRLTPGGRRLRIRTSSRPVRRLFLSPGMPSCKRTQVYNLNVVAQDVLATPEEVKRRVMRTERAERTVVEGRATVERILDRQDHRLLVVVGPCSIHDPVAAMDYARRLKALADEDGRRALRRDARLLREAAHDDRLEGPHQRSAHERLVRHRARPPARPQGAARRERTGPARRHGGARPDQPAVPRRPRQLERHRRPHDRIADAPRDGERPVDAGRLQERHGRRTAGRGERAAVGVVASAQLPRDQSGGAVAIIARVATRTDTSSCAAARRVRTTTRPRSRRSSRNSRRQSCPRTSSSTRATPIPTRTQPSSRTSCRTSPRRSSTATSRSSA
jgi:hypothetical protein